MPDPSPRRAYDKVSFEQVLYTRNTDILEHLTLLATLKSYKFYNQIKSRLCPRLPDGRSFRPDFTRADFNYIYSFAAQFWESIARVPIVGDMSIKADLMELLLAKKVQQNMMALEDAQAISSWLKDDLTTIDIEPEILRTLPGNTFFLKWLEERATEYEHRRLSAASLGRAPTLLDLQASVRSVQQTVAPPGSRFVRPADIIGNDMDFAPPIPTRLTRLNDLLGGGFRHRDTSIVGAVSGGGKTILAMQFALDFALADRKTVVLTTEQPPWQLMMRMISNHMSLDFALFTTRVERAARGNIANVTLPFIPNECLVGECYETMNYLADKCDKNLLFIDWSEGNVSFEKDFDAAVEGLITEHPGWNPEIIIADWIGGGLDHTSTHGDNLRHYYKAAAEVVIGHGKRNNRIMIAMAQLNKTMVTNTTPYIGMGHLAECKSLVDNAANFIAPTCLTDKDHKDSDSSGVRLRPFQFMCADKTRFGVKGSHKVVAEFQYQRFANVPPHLRGGG